MALGDKLFVVMGKEKAVPSGVATLDENGILAEAQRPSAAEILTLNGKSVEEALKSAGLPTGGLEGQALVKAGADSATPTKWGPWPSNPNLLINSDFRNPVNRNGKTTYTRTGFFIDCWQSTTNTFIGKLENNTLFISRSGTSGVSFSGQLVQANLIGKIVTGSLLLTNNILLQCSGIVAVSDSAFASTGSAHARIRLDLNSTDENSINFSLRVANDINIIAAKLEFGDQQTLAHKEGDTWVLNDPPNYDLQYALCSQYSPITGEFVGSQHSNPNLLDNAYWADKVAIINQRGLNEYTNAGYTIDRWYKGLNILLSILDNSITISANEIDDSSNVLSQKVNITQPAGQIHTLSALVKGNGILRNLGGGALSFNTTDFELIQLPITALNITEIQIRLLPTQTVEVKAIKLELGPVQTLAHKEGDTWILNDPPPNKALELAKCQRYFQRVNGTSKWMNIGLITYAANSTSGTITIPLTVPMRNRPSITFTNLVMYPVGQSNNIGIISITPDQISPNFIRYRVTFETAPSSSGITWAQLPGGGDVDLSAEL